MSDIEKLVSVVQNANSTVKNIGADSDYTELLRKLRVPYHFLSDEEKEELMPIIKEFDLENPVQLTKMLVKIHFANIEAINRNINSLKMDNLDKTVARVDYAVSIMKIADENPSEYNKFLEKSFDSLAKAESELKRIIKSNIAEIERIDNMSSIQFHIHSKSNVSTINSSVPLASLAFQDYMETIYLLSIVSRTLHRKMSTYINLAEEFIKELQEKDIFSLMRAYSKAKEHKDFWSLQDRQQELEKIKSTSESLEDYLNKFRSEETEVDLENDIIF